MIRFSGRLRARGRPRVRLAAAAALVVAAAGGCSSGNVGWRYGAAPSRAPAAPAVQPGGAMLALRHTTLGTIVTTGQGVTVYAFEADRGSTSACTGACAAAWPPVTAGGARITVAGGAVGALAGQTTRPGGARQLTYAGHPLYTYAGDAGPGATNGQGSRAFGARWDVLTAAGQEVTGG